jgi:hypothetical protein
LSRACARPRCPIRSEHIPSGLLPKADFIDAFRHFRFVPILLQKSVDGFCER